MSANKIDPFSHVGQQMGRGESTLEVENWMGEVLETK